MCYNAAREGSNSNFIFNIEQGRSGVVKKVLAAMLSHQHYLRKPPCLIGAEVQSRDHQIKGLKSYDEDLRVQILPAPLVIFDNAPCLLQYTNNYTACQHV